MEVTFPGALRFLRFCDVKCSSMEHNLKYVIHCCLSVCHSAYVCRRAKYAYSLSLSMSARELHFYKCMIRNIKEKKCNKQAQITDFLIYIYANP